MSLPFSSFPSFVSSFQTLWHAGIQIDGNGEMDWWPVPCCFRRSVTISPSLFSSARMHSVSVSNIYSHLEGPPQIGHPTQTKRPIDLQIQSFPSLVGFLLALPISLRLRSRCFQFVCELDCLPFCPPIVSKYVPFP